MATSVIHCLVAVLALLCLWDLSGNNGLVYGFPIFADGLKGRDKEVEVPVERSSTSTLPRTTMTTSLAPELTGQILCPVEEIVLNFDDIEYRDWDTTVPVYHNLEFPAGFSSLDWRLVSKSTIGAPPGPASITSGTNAIYSLGRGSFVSFGIAPGAPVFTFDLLSFNITAWTNKGEGSGNPEGLVLDIIGTKKDSSNYPLTRVTGIIDAGGVKYVHGGELGELKGLVKVWLAAWDLNAKDPVRRVSANFVMDDLKIRVRATSC